MTEVEEEEVVEAGLEEHFCLTQNDIDNDLPD